jgi:pimeloyl-ACP methyl ester carboxylesterase
VSSLASDLQAFLSALGEECHLPVLIGSSMGASVAWSFSEQFGCERICGIVVVDQAPLQNRAEDWALGSKGCFDMPSLAALQASLQADLGAFADGNAACCLSSREIPAETLALLKAETLRCDAAVLGELMADHTARDWRPLLRRLAVPSLVIAGELSGCFPVAGCLWAAENAPPGSARSVVMANCNHWLYIEQPATFAAEVGNWLDALAAMPVQESRAADAMG